MIFWLVLLTIAAAGALIASTAAFFSLVALRAELARERNERLASDEHRRDVSRNRHSDIVQLIDEKHGALVGQVEAARHDLKEFGQVAATNAVDTLTRIEQRDEEMHAAVLERLPRRSGSKNPPPRKGAGPVGPPQVPGPSRAI